MPKTAGIQDERVVRLNDLPVRPGRYVLYWMQASQRAQCNHALEYAVAQANALRQPLLVGFGLTGDFPRANLRHYTFMLQGLAETQQHLRDRGIQLVVLAGTPSEVALRLAEPASLIVTDCGYLRIQRQWREQVAERAKCQVVEVESDAVVPVELASQREEYSAGTLRPKLRRHLKRFLVPLTEARPRRDSLDIRLQSLDLQNVGHLLNSLRLDREVPPTSAYTGGFSHAKRLLDQFIAERLKDYARCRSDPSLNCVSHMSVYLHFGQISPLQVSLEVQRARDVPRESKEAYLEQLIVRRELSLNFVNYNDRYDSFDAIPAWAQKSLLTEKRPKPIYSAGELEHAQTGDEYWNAAQREMVCGGKMHGYMRMYWGKRLLEWLPPREAHALAVELNDKYELDGRDPNSYAGIAWCFGKHDRPWPARPLFGNVRSMRASGLERKFDMDAYVARVRQICREQQPAANRGRT